VLAARATPTRPVNRLHPGVVKGDDVGMTLHSRQCLDLLSHA
jgi:hypothetical protein